MANSQSPTEPQAPLTLRVPADLLADFRQATRERDRSMSQELRRFMRAYVADHKKQAAA